MGVLYALASALCYGLADFAGGLLARRSHFAAVALVGQTGGLLLALAAVPLLPATSLQPADLAWGALSGVGTGIGMVFLFRGLSHGTMSVVVPVSAVAGVALPVLVGVAVLGDRPSALAWLGVLIAVPALWLVSRDGRTDGGGPAGAPDALIAGTGIALQYLALAQAGPGAGVWPVAAGRVAAIATVLPLVVRSRARLRMPPRRLLGAAATGMTASAALVLYMLAAREQLLAIAVVLSSLYPAIPVLLGVTALRERLTRWQAAGLLGAGAATLLLATG
ncbi:EamA family transporter [Actinomadura hibisca]|uniref:EamA family transporter n=1 Tax=Actinomadura hibisca TaxID=68565 RepID=UPI00082FEDF6|nr:EamA family transporter [Actinomadura hibisca]